MAAIANYVSLLEAIYKKSVGNPMVLADFPRMASTSLKPPTSWVNLSDLTVMMLDTGIYPHIALLILLLPYFRLVMF